MIFFQEYISSILVCNFKNFFYFNCSSIMVTATFLCQLSYFFLQVAEPMQMEFIKLKEARDNPTDEMQSECY